jgi:hypothetical protein
MSRIQRIDDIYEYILDQSMYVLEPGVFYNALFYCTASAMGTKNIRIVRKTNRGDKVIIPSYFAITMSQSGAGKDHAFKKSEELFGNMFTSLVDRAQSFYESSRDNTGKASSKYINPTAYFVPIISNDRGIRKAAQTYTDFRFGSVNLYEAELGDRILSMQDMFDLLKKAWDTGTVDAPLNASDGGEAYFQVKDMQINCLLYGAPGPFTLDPKRQDALIMAYITGMARRTFIYHNASFKKSENKNPNFEQMDSDTIARTRDYLQELRSFINNTKEIYLPNDVYKMLMDYDDTKQTLREQSHSMIAEDLGAPQKIEKLLGIIAVLDLSNTITENHLKFAIEFTEMMDKTAIDTVELKPDHILVYELLIQRDFMARTDILKNVKGVTLKSLDDIMTLVEEYASMLGNALIKKEYSKIVKYKIEKLSKSNIEEVETAVQALRDDIGYIPQVGSFAFTGPSSSSTPAAVTITLPSGYFDTAPTVVATVSGINTSNAYFPVLHSITASQFQVRVWTTNATAGESLTLQWIAK